MGWQVYLGCALLAVMFAATYYRVIRIRRDVKEIKEHLEDKGR